MIQGLIKSYKSLRMRNQIFIINFFVLLVVLPITALMLYIQFLIFNFVSTNSETLILARADRSEVIKSSNLVVSMMQLKNMKAINQLISISDFYDFYYQRKDNIVTTRPEQQCLHQNQNLTFRSRCPQFCYSIADILNITTIPSDNEQLQDLTKGTQFLDQVGLLLELTDTQLIQIAAISNMKYFSQYPIARVTPTYDITTRPWYPSHVSQVTKDPNLRLIFQTYFYFYIASRLDVAGTYSIFNEKKERVGIIKNSLTINQNLLPKVPFNVLLVDNTGTVIYNYLEYNLTSQQIYIYNESSTGFNSTDWQQLKNSLNQSQNTVLSLYNKLYKSQVNVIANLFAEENFTCILFSNITNQDIIINQLEEIALITYNYVVNSLLIVFLVSFAIILIDVIIMAIIFKPFGNMNEFVKDHVLKMGNNINQFTFQKRNGLSSQMQKIVSNQLINLTRFLDKNQNFKSNQCKLYEQFDYSKQDKDISLKEMRKQLYKIPICKKSLTQNQYVSFTRYCLKKITF